MAKKQKTIDELMVGTGLTKSEALNIDTQKQAQQVQAARTQKVVLPKAGSASGGKGGRVNAETASKITLPASPIAKFLHSNDDAAEMTYGIYDPKASERSRVGNTFAAGAKGWTSGQANALAFLLDPTDDGSMTDAEMMFDPTGAGRSLGENPVAHALNRERAKASASLYKSAADLSKASKESEETAKKGTGKLASTLIDLGITGTQLALDATVGRATGAGMTSMGTRVFGQSARQALDEGASQQQAFNYGASAAAVELLTEKMFDVGKIFGKGAGDEWVEKKITDAVKKWGLTDKGRSALRTFFAMASEAGEEVASDLVNPVIQEFYKSDAFKEAYLTGEGRKQMLADVGKDALLGALMGGIGNVANVGNNRTQNARIDETIRNERLQELEEQRQRQERIFGGNTMQTGTADAEAAELLRKNAQARGELVLPMAGVNTNVVNQPSESRAAMAKFVSGQNITEAELETITQDRAQATEALKAMGADVSENADAAELQQKFREIAPDQIQTAPAEPVIDPETQARADAADNEIRRSGILAGASEESIQSVERMATALGKDIRFVNEAASADGGIRNGYYDNRTGILYLNSQSQNVEAKVVSHELTHSTESAEIYQELSQLVQQRISRTADLQAIRDEVKARYAAAGVELDEDGISHEVVAEFVENHLLTSEEDIVSLVQEDRTLAQRIRDFLDRILAKLGNRSAQERAFVQRARDLYAQALGQSETTSGQQINQLKDQLRRGEITEEEFNERYDRAYNAEDALRAEVQNSYAGQNAKTANLQTLAQAKQMLSEDVAPETIRQQTGWFQGRDGKWRFEVDDSGSTYQRGGDVRFREAHPEYAEYQDLLEKMFYDTENFTDEDEARLQELDDLYSNEFARLSERVDRGNATLGEIFDHEALYEAYPQLRDVKVEFKEDMTGRGAFDPSKNTIYLKSSLRSNSGGVGRGVLLHEIQHAIQHIEGFSTGSSVDAWRRRLKNGYTDERKAAEIKAADENYRKLFDAAPEELKRKIRELNRAKLSGDVDAWDRIEADLYSGPYGDQFVEIDQADFERRSLRDSERNYDPYELYQNTAGEIEARDTQNRRNLTAEERKNTPPDLGDENTVFAESGGVQDSFVNGAITVDSTENERFETLKDATITPAEVDYSKIEDVDLDAFATRKISAVEKPIKIIAERLGLHDISFQNSFIEIPFQMSRNSLGKSIHHQNDYAGSYQDFVKALSCIEDLVTNAVPIETHTDKKVGTIKENKDLQQVYVMLGLMKDGERYVPIQFEVKEFKTRENQLYLTIALKNIDSEVVEQGSRNNVDGVPALFSESNISVADIFQNVNTKDGRFLKYVPDGFLNEDQKLVKREALSEDEYRAESGTVLPKANSSTLQNSISGPAKTDGVVLPKAGENTANTREERLPEKAKRYLQKARNTAVNRLAETLSVPRWASREYLQPIAQQASEEYLRTGKVSQETRERLFNEAYDQGVVVVDDYYQAMKPVKDFVRSARLTVPKEVQADIADFGSWRRQYMGQLNIVKDGSWSIDQLYQDLQEMVPGQFPDDVANEADQLRYIAEFVDGIRKTEHTLDGFYGDDAETFKAWAKNDFDEAMDSYVAELNRVKRYGEDKTEQPKAEPVTAENAAQAYRDLKEQRRAYDMASAKNLLTEADEVAVGRILRGEDTVEGLNPRKYNVKGIREVVESKRAYEETARRIREYKKSIKAARKETADGYLGTVLAWKDKKMGAQYSRETMERNIRDIVSDRKSADAIVEHYFTPVHANEAAATRMKNEFRERVSSMNLSRKVQDGNLVSEAHAVQLLGEAMDNINYIKEHKRIKERDGKTLADWNAVVQELRNSNPNMNWEKIEQATESFRGIYDELFQQMNEVRIRNGYEPINYRKGYFPHFQPGDASGLLENFSRALGISADVTSLPTTINGLTHQFRPGIRWFGNAQQRLGFNTVYDAVEGFDRYIEGAADVIHHTDDIQNLRALSDQIRYRASDQGIREQVDRVQRNESLTEDEKQQLTNSTFEKGKTHLANFVVELEEYTNLLANKRSRADRDMEQRLGRNAYNLAKRFESRVAANMVAINPGSWLTNFIPLTQGWTTTNSKYMLQGMWDALRSFKADDGFANRSDFLTNRRGSDPLVKMWEQSSKAPTAWQKVNAVSGRAGEILSSPMEYIDQFTAGSLVRARFKQNVAKGMSEDAALTEADAWASGIMADRSKGSMPTVFAQQNPLKKVFTQFQLEVNNELSWLAKDVPDELKEKTLGAAALSIFKFLIGSFLFNELYEALVGRRSALDPLGIINDTVGDFTGYQLPNLVDLAGGASFETEKEDAYTALANLGGSVAENIPFIGGILGGGRVPISSALPDVSGTAKTLLDEDTSSKKKVNKVLKELGNSASYIVLPFGGSQLRKTAQAVSTIARGGSYTVDNEGNDILQYAVDNKGVKGVLGAAKMLAFGKSSTRDAREWVESGFKGLNAKETAAYQELTDGGQKKRDALKLVQAISAETGKGSNDRRSEIIRKSNLTDGQKQALYSTFVSDGRDDEFTAMRNAGMSWNQVMDTYAQYKKYDEAKGNSSTRASQFSAWVDSNLTANQAKVVKDKLQIWAMMPANTDRYEKLRSQGLGSSDAIKLSETLAALEPQDGRSQPTDLQKYQAIVRTNISDKAKAAGIKGIMSDEVRPKYEATEKYDVSPDVYVSAYAKVVELKEKYGKTSVNADLAKEAIDSIPGLTTEQRAALWQVQKKNFNPSKNPYDVRVGQDVYKIQYGLDDSALVLP